MWYTTYNVALRPPSAADRRMETEALALCYRCPVLEPCETWALSDPEPATDMVAGGFTPARRRAIRLNRAP